jgi:hypothetical protein
MMRTILAGVGAAILLASTAIADEKNPLEFKLGMKKESIAWPYEQGPKDFEAKLKEAVKQKGANLPKPPAIAAIGQITNTGKEKVTIYVDGDPNTLTLTLTGPGVVPANVGGAFTTDFRIPKAVVLEPGKSHEIAITSLADGFRRATRYIYPTAPGEYKLSATYQLTNSEGAKTTLLKSNEVKFKVEEPR